MSTRTSSKSVARLRGINYDVYSAIRDVPANDGYRITYHNGVMEIVSPDARHRYHTWRIGLLVHEYCVAIGMPYEPAGSTTFRKGEPKERKGYGKEPDASFYLGDEADHLRGKDTIDLEVDPPPSLWIEVDHRVSSAGRLPLYSSLGIPEVWQYRPRKRRLRLGALVGDTYEELAESRVILGLTPGLMLDQLDVVNTRGQTGWALWFRNEWLPQHRRPGPGT